MRNGPFGISIRPVSHRNTAHSGTLSPQAPLTPAPYGPANDHTPCRNAARKDLQQGLRLWKTMLITMLKTPLISVLKPHRLINNKHTKAPDMGISTHLSKAFD